MNVKGLIRAATVIALLRCLLAGKPIHTHPDDDGEGATRALDLTVLLEEYKAMRGELTARVEKQQDITNFAIAVIVGSFAVAKVADSQANVDQLFANLYPYLPFVSIVLSSFALMELDHEMNIAHISRYIDSVLAPAIARISGSDSSVDLLGWNRFRARHQQRWPEIAITTPMASAKYFVTIVPNLGALLTYALSEQRHEPVCWELLVASVVLLCTLICAGFTSLAYTKMAKDSVAAK